MSELLEKTNYNEEQYFERKLGNHYDNSQPVASPNYSVPASDQPFEEQESNVSKKKRKLSLMLDNLFLKLKRLIKL